MIALPGTFWQHPEAYTDGRNAPIMVSTAPRISFGLTVNDREETER